MLRPAHHFHGRGPHVAAGVEVTLPVASRASDIASERIFVDVPLSFSKDRRVFLERNRSASERSLSASGN